MKTLRTDTHPQTTNDTPALPRLLKKVRRLVMAAYAAQGGATHMTLNEWRDVEQQLVGKLQNENHERQRY